MDASAPLIFRRYIVDSFESPHKLDEHGTLAIMLDSWFVPCIGACVTGDDCCHGSVRTGMPLFVFCELSLVVGYNGETYRLFETLEAGALPVIVSSGATRRHHLASSH